MLKVYAAGMISYPMDIKENFIRAKREVSFAIEKGADLVVFPEGFLSGVQLGVLKNAPYFHKQYNDFSRQLCEDFARSDIGILADFITTHGFENIFYKSGTALNGENFSLGGFALRSFNSLEELKQNAYTLNCEGVILNYSQPVLAGERSLLFDFLNAINSNTSVDIFLNLGGLGFTSHPHVFLPCGGIFSKAVTHMSTTLPEFVTMDRIFLMEKPTHLLKNNPYLLPELTFKPAFNQNPLLPKEVDEEAYCLDLFHLQGVALSSRLANIGCKTAVVALSGGLDSALALLVTLNAFDILGMDKSGIKPVSMPGFGTSHTTKNLAEELALASQLEYRVIDITACAHRALIDIGHDGFTPDVTYENVQARMRTLNALNLANSLGGIMVGTGDLSEEALGFSTYGGDHLASYNVNSSLSKTIIRTMLPYVVKLPQFAPFAQVIDKILNIPVSPELVPHGGEILQKTEEILAPYKLIDFFIYCFVIAKLSPIEMAQRASCVFEGEFSSEYLRQKAQMFCRRFIQGQFKRSSSPEGAALTHLSLNTEDKSLPSDCKMGVFNYYFGE
ncbi:MAG: hypothetical protein RRX95_05350 [Oscillospiraceae bacterium]